VVEEVGVVLRVEGELAIVKTKRSSMCDGCGTGGLCKAVGGSSDMEVPARNDVGAKVGDAVRMTVASKAFLKASFLVYMLPVAALIVGALLGTQVGPALYPKASGDLFAVVFGMALFFLSFVLMRMWTKGIKGGQSYSPVISEIVYGEAHMHQ
jgi:sigma-E factor negative regulatory protein RseC